MAEAFKQTVKSKVTVLFSYHNKRYLTKKGENTFLLHLNVVF